MSSTASQRVRLLSESLNHNLARREDRQGMVTSFCFLLGCVIALQPESFHSRMRSHWNEFLELVQVSIAESAASISDLMDQLFSNVKSLSETALIPESVAFQFLQSPRVQKGESLHGLSGHTNIELQNRLISFQKCFSSFSQCRVLPSTKQSTKSSSVRFRVPPP